MEDLVRLSGGLCAVASAIVVYMMLRGGAKAGLMDLQLATDPEAARAGIPKGDDPRREVLQRVLRIDFAFIVAYWFALGALAILLAQRGDLFIPLGAVAMVLVTGSALLDAVENVRTLGMLSLTRGQDQLRPEVLDGVRSASLSKWALGFLATAALSALFWSVHWIMFLAILLLAAAILGLYAVKAARPRLIVAGFALQGLALVIVAVLFVGWPGTVLESF
jgi:hypothetical protein